MRGGIFQGVNTTLGREIESSGGWAEVGVKAADHVLAYVGYALDNPKNADLSTGGRSANKIVYGALRFPFDAVEFGLEYLNWTTEYIGFGDGTDNRIGVFFAYKF